METALIFIVAAAFGFFLGLLLAYTILKHAVDDTKVTRDDINRMVARSLKAGSRHSWSDIDDADDFADGALTIQLKKKDRNNEFDNAYNLSLLLDHLGLRLEEGKRIVKIEKGK